MSMKVMAFSILPIAIWISAWVGMPRANLASAISAHRLFSSKVGEISAPGFSQSLVNAKLIQNSYLLKAVGDFGYQIRFAFGMYPSWLEIVPDPFRADRKHIIVREEVDVEFSNDLILKSLLASESETLEIVKKFALNKGIEPMVFVVPTKISVNRLKVEPEQALGRDRGRFRIDSSSTKWVGGLANLAESERRMAASGIKILSGIEAVRWLQVGSMPVYPYGESHWSAEMILALAPTLARQIAQKNPELKHCFDLDFTYQVIDESPKKFYGDMLTSSLGWSVDLDISQYFRNDYKTYGPVRQKLAREASCPELFYVGSSYGTFEISGLNIVGVLANIYRGNVTNRSLGGLGPKGPLEVFEQTVIPKNSLVIWEFTFRAQNG
jgi:hypothetical protein